MTPPLPYPALHASHSGIWLSTPLGETRRLGRGEAVARASETPMILLNAPLVGERLGYPDLAGLDLLELFAFIHPARFVVPTVKGLAAVLGLAVPGEEGEIPGFLMQAADALLATLAGAPGTVPGQNLRQTAESKSASQDLRPGTVPSRSSRWPERAGAWDSLQSLARLRWPWARVVAERLEMPKKGERWLFSRLPEWDETPPRPAPRPVHLAGRQVLERLGHLTGHGAEERPSQRDYALANTPAFAPRRTKDAPNLVLAEAGTGIGKTLGYLAPASLWAEQAQGTVWISTFTKALQRQLDAESVKLFPDPLMRKAKVVVRKGRENYLCLLNLEDALQGGFAGRAAILAQLVARWAAFTRDGDMVGGDLPGWLPALFRRNGATALTDRRGECVYAGCPHYRKCFIEHAAKASNGADIVIANHALVMVNAARGREAANKPKRIVFDEGHHLADAADGMFAAALTGQEAIELRRWIIGPEGKSRGRRRGLAARLADMASYDGEGSAAINAAALAAQALPADGWLQRVADGEPFGALEAMLAAVRGQTYARGDAEDAGYGLETEASGLDGRLITAVEPAVVALDAILRPLVSLGRRLEAVMEEAPDWLDAPARARIEGAMASLGWRRDTLVAWLSLLSRLGGPSDPDFVDWLAVDRMEGRETDIGLHRHWLDPTKPFAEAVLKAAHGVVITSATLRGGEDWAAAEARTGTVHLEGEHHHFLGASPFDYASQSAVLIVTDIKRGDVPQIAGAFAKLIAAAGGGTLGLFTAIRRLRAVHARIADRLAQDGLPLYAQHVDPIDTGTLVDIFRDDPHASLLGTDALRDGVDVPGASLRQVIMEGVPWPKPTVLHAARKAAGGGSAYDDRIIRARLAQAFGRLIRRADDHGVFVILSAAMPSRLLTAFPPGTPIKRVSLDEAVAEVMGMTRTGLSTAPQLGHHLAS